MATGRQGKPRPLIHSLDGGAHDARWRAAMGEGAAVVLPEAHSGGSGSPAATPAPASPTREPVSVGAVIAERPW